MGGWKQGSERLWMEMTETRRHKDERSGDVCAEASNYEDERLRSADRKGEG
jgi:hypothetical protein